MAINIRKINAVILEGEPYHAWGTKYNKYIRLSMGHTNDWYLLDDNDRIVTDILPNTPKMENLYKESCGFLEQLELF
jgi:hypothetical protein